MAKTTKRINGDYDLITNDGTTGSILLDSGTVTSITVVAAITIVVAFFLFTRPQKR